MIASSSGYLTRAEACARLGVKPQTLYAYVSRGLVRSVPTGSGQVRGYASGDIDRLRTRHDARKGHEAVAASALRWGEPVLSSSITEIRSNGPAYRGQSAVELANAGVSFESVSELLWRDVKLSPQPWPFDRATKRAFATPMGAVPTVQQLLVAVLERWVKEATPPGETDARYDRARAIITTACTSLFPASACKTAKTEKPMSIAARLTTALGGRTSGANVAAVNAALIVCADHELNPSTFAARIAASVGADLPACLIAALAVLSGPKHGGASAAVDSLVSELNTPARAKQEIPIRLREGAEVPGFGHPLYPEGDPRVGPLLTAAKRARSTQRAKVRVATTLAIIQEMRRAGHPPPNLDVGLSLVASAANLRPGASIAMFAIGRMVGWIAHVLEQQKAGFTLRPRARYIGD